MEKGKQLYRDELLRVYVTEDEKKRIKMNMDEAGISTLTNYLRIMGLHGFILRINFSDFKEFLGAFGQLNFEFNRIGNNINQIAKKVNETDELDDEDFQNLKNEFENLKKKYEFFEKTVFQNIQEKINRLKQ